MKEKIPPDMQDFILRGWKCKESDKLGSNILYEGVFEAEGKTDRHIYAGEYEKLLGLDVNASNGIAKIQGESLSDRETRRKALLELCFPKKVWSFICHAAILDERVATPCAVAP